MNIIRKTQKECIDELIENDYEAFVNDEYNLDRLLRYGMRGYANLPVEELKEVFTKRFLNDEEKLEITKFLSDE